MITAPTVSRHCGLSTNAERITELSDTLTESISEKARAVQEGRTHKTSRGGRDR